MYKPLKEQSTRSIIVKVVIGVLIGILIGWLSGVYAPVDLKPHSQPVITAKIKPVVMVNSIDPKVWGLKQARRFRAGKMHNSHGRRLPSMVRAALHRYVTKNPGAPVAWAGVKGIVKAQACMWNSPNLSYPGCYLLAHSPYYSSLEKEIVKVKILCGGAGAIAGLAGGGVVGFGAGAAGCVFERYASAVVNKW